MDVYEPISCTKGVVGSPDEIAAGGGMPVWFINYRRPDGGIHSHVEPAHAFAARAGELGLDTSDPAAIIALVLHEPFHGSHDTNIYAVPADDARKGHLARHKRTRKDGVSIDHHHPVLAAIHDDHGITPAAVARFAKQAEHHRSMHKERIRRMAEHIKAQREEGGREPTP